MIKFIDLFAGIGGIRLAFEQQGFKCVASSEIDNEACRTYELNFHERPLGDIKQIKSEDFPEFEVLCAGFPCQPFSIAGKRKGFEDTRGTLFFDVARILEEKRPKCLFLENVAGIVTHDNGNTLKIIENTLHDLQYDFDWKLMNACDYGIPQNRNRWYCVGFRKDLRISFTTEKNKKCFSFPKKSCLIYKTDDIILSHVSDCYKSTPIACNNIKKFLNDYLKSDRFKQNQNLIIANEIRPSRCNFRSDGISPCLTAKMGTGGNNIPVVVSQYRKLTERECLKIMGFPESFKISPNKASTYKQIGNSVVVYVVSQIAEQIKKVLI